MDGENNGKPYFLMDDLGGMYPYFWVDTHIFVDHHDYHRHPPQLHNLQRSCRETPWRETNRSTLYSARQSRTQRVGVLGSDGGKKQRQMISVQNPGIKAVFKTLVGCLI